MNGPRFWEIFPLVVFAAFPAVIFVRSIFEPEIGPHGYVSRYDDDI